MYQNSVYTHALTFIRLTHLPNRLTKHLSTSFFTALLTAVCLMGAMPNSAQAQVKIGEEAPNFELKDQFGKTHNLKDYQGKVVVLEWTNPTCPFVVYHYQRDTMTNLIAKNPEVVWLHINSSYFTTAKENMSWAKAEGVKTVLADPSGQVGRSYNARTTPHMFIIDTEGKLVYQGAIDDNPHREDRKALNYIDLALQALKSKKKIEIPETQAYGCSVKYKK